MSRARMPQIALGAVALALSCALAGCGHTTQVGSARKLHVTLSEYRIDPETVRAYAGAQLFQQRCGGCHTLSYAGTHGSASNIHTAQANNGPNFNVRCERPITRVLYAIENGGFSGAIMPQNVVIGKQAAEVAEFVAKYAGRQAARAPGVPTCQQTAIGSLPLQQAALIASGP